MLDKIKEILRINRRLSLFLRTKIFLIVFCVVLLLIGVAVAIFTTRQVTEEKSNAVTNLNPSPKIETASEAVPVKISEQQIVILNTASRYREWDGLVKELLTKEKEKAVQFLMKIAITPIGADMSLKREIKYILWQKYTILLTLFEHYPDEAFEGTKELMRYDQDMSFCKKWDIEKYGIGDIDTLSIELDYRQILFRGIVLSGIPKGIKYMESLQDELLADSEKRKEHEHYFNKLSEGLAGVEYVKANGKERYLRLINGGGDFLGEMGPYMRERNPILNEEIKKLMYETSGE